MTALVGWQRFQSRVTVEVNTLLGGILLSSVGMLFAAAGYLPPVAGALTQEAIDLAAVLNALRVSLPFKELADFNFEHHSGRGDLTAEVAPVPSERI